MSLKSLEFSRLQPLFLLLCFTFTLSAGQTTALYQPTSLTVGPFPTNALSVPDPDQSTGIRIDLPPSSDSCDPSASPSVCSNTALLNQLDGFSVNPRIMVCFSAAVDPGTLQAGIQIVPLSGGAPIGINQIILNHAGTCAFAKPNQVLNQQSRYLLTVTDSVHDSTGKKVKQDDAFSNCLKSSDSYCQALDQAMDGVTQHPASQNKVVAASLFTTMSATTWLEKARRYVDAHELPIVLPAGLPFSFQLSNLSKDHLDAGAKRVGTSARISRSRPCPASAKLPSASICRRIFWTRPPELSRLLQLTIPSLDRCRFLASRRVCLRDTCRSLFTYSSLPVLNLWADIQWSSMVMAWEIANSERPPISLLLWRKMDSQPSPWRLRATATEPEAWYN